MQGPADIELEIEEENNEVVSLTIAIIIPGQFSPPHPPCLFLRREAT